ncbi:hypothetical protein BHE74_00034426 [Ensete ventricosum]|nr:hypothetical protein BHE74_00034426 [Ensete ventricosum]
MKGLERCESKEKTCKQIGQIPRALRLTHLLFHGSPSPRLDDDGVCCRHDHTPGKRSRPLGFSGTATVRSLRGPDGDQSRAEADRDGRHTGRERERELAAAAVSRCGLCLPLSNFIGR